jgi:hypothetical protein
VTGGAVCVDDFYIGHPRFGYDTYGRRCDAQLVADAMPGRDLMFVSNPFAAYPLPCLQTGRRAGVGYIPLGRPNYEAADVMNGSDMFCAVSLRPQVLMPSWPSTQTLTAGLLTGHGHGPDRVSAGETAGGAGWKVS